MSDTKEKIIDAAIQLFADKGYTEASMRGIAQIVGIKPSSIYNHFTSKAEILDEIFKEYISNSNRNAIRLEEIDRMMETESAADILRKMFFSFPKEEAERYMKMLKIILHEQFREPRAGHFVKEYMFRDTFRYYKSILDKLMELGKIIPTDTGVYAKMLVSLSVSASLESMFYTVEEYRGMDRVTRLDVMEYFIRLLVPEA